MISIILQSPFTYNCDHNYKCIYWSILTILILSIVSSLPVYGDTVLPGLNTYFVTDSIDTETGDIEYRVVTLDGLEVTAGNNRYSKKNNPAYELMKNIRKNKHLGDPRMLPEYSESFYTKTVLGLNNCDASQFRGKDKYRYLE